MEKVTVKMNREGTFEPVGYKLKELNPKAMLLFATASCAGLTAVSLFRKMQLKPKSFEITLSGTTSTETTVAETLFTAFDIVYNLECGTMEEQARFSHALNLTNDKLCGMLMMMRRIAPVTYNIYIHSTEAVEN